MSSTRPLGSTYRLQLSGFGFAAARGLVGYLDELGIETLYVSPILAAVPGSTHGYDVIDPTRLDPALGTPEEFEALLAELDAHHMRLLIDIVPNHMATHVENTWWWATQREGKGSPIAATFDIDWSRHDGRVMVPTLGRPLADSGDDLTIGEHEGQRVMEIQGQRFPLANDVGDVGDVRELLERQHYRPAYWRLSNDEGNYRRFFDIDGLIGVRVEDGDVFARTHAYLATLAPDERVAGWRVDHVDGLTDPAVYLQQLRVLSDASRQSAPAILIEKILAHDEALPAWPVEGTTGYEFAERVGGLFVDRDGALALEDAGRAFTGEEDSFASLALEAKFEVMRSSFAAPLDRLARLAKASFDVVRPGHDLSWSDVRQAVAELTAQMDVYRTYAQRSLTSPEDLARLRRAGAQALKHTAGETARALELLIALLEDGALDPEFAQRWQQLSGAVMAKGVEDTATYRYSGLLSHAEVGCDPDHSSTTPQAFHDFLEDRRHFPSALNATSTHDSKRSEDTRARLFTLSEMSGRWTAQVTTWRRRYVVMAPGPHDELVVYQSLFSLWPLHEIRLSRDIIRRVQGYVVKAAREGKRTTTWSDPNVRYERTLTSFVSALARDERFAREMNRIVKRIGPAAATNSLAMTVLKCVVPGVPDFYQGSELWDLTLTDPDNRRPVDFTRRRRVLDSLPTAGTGPTSIESSDILTRWRDGTVKLHVERELLHLRRRRRELFSAGSHLAPSVSGALSSRVVTTARQWGEQWAVAVAPRLMLDVTGGGRFAVGHKIWGDGATIRLPPNAPTTLRNIFTGELVHSARGRLLGSECLATFPVAVLVDEQ